MWSSFSTLITGNIIHVCFSTRKIDNLYCLSAGTHPSFEIPTSTNNNSSTITPGIDQGNATAEPVNFPYTPHPVTAASRLVIDDTDERVANAVKVVEEQLQVHRSWRSKSNKNYATCDGNGIYVYDLPSKFNKDLDFCSYLSNEGLGEPIAKLGKGWYKTHQYSLELIFHSRVLRHPCRVSDETVAKLFYVPFYGGLDILRWHFKNVSNDVKDSLSLELVKLLELDKMQNPIKLLIERQPWHVNDIGIPHPTNFHPHSDNDIVSWQLKIIRSNRKNLVSFAGAARANAEDNTRSALINQCTSLGDGKCHFMNCSSVKCGEAESVIELFVESEFCLQPPGDSCIPVLFDPFTAYYQYPWHLPHDHDKYSVFMDKKELTQMNVVERLANISLRERENMRRYIVYELLPGLVYGNYNAEPDKFHDAFAITMNNLLERVSLLEQPHKD
ncbi:hypothetical protein V8G54_017261 [Vigna mungo]|uniref:Exostosin GT47 domain-containing protein n=1 Tax=Vigna mungo TaxID=3915 RepID=A0AAQ3NMN9_VIGMU